MSLQKLAAQFGFNVDAKSVDSAINSVNSIDKEISRVSRSASKFMGLLGAGGIGAAMFSFAKNAVEEFSKEQQEINLLNNALANLGITNRSVTNDLLAFAKAQSKITMATDEEILAAERSLIQRGLTGEALKQAIKDSLDLAVKTGSLSSAVEVVGKSYQGVTKGLNQLGIVIDAATPKSEVFLEVHKQIQEHFKGAAQTQMAGYAGAVHSLSQEWDEFSKSLGETFTPMAILATKALNGLISVLPREESKEHRLKAMEDDLVAYKKHLEELKGPKGGFWDWWDRSPAAIAQAEHNIAVTEKMIALQKSQMGGTGSSVATRSGGVNTDDDAERVKARKLAIADAIRDDKEYLKENQKMLAQENEITGFSLTEKGRMYTRFFGQQDMERRKNLALEAGSAKQMEVNYKQMLDRLQQDYAAAGRTVSGGWRQAIDEMNQNGTNWKGNWTQIINSSTAAGTTAIHNFVHSSGDEFKKLGKLAEDMFKGILNAFEAMVEQMAAKAAIFGLISLVAPGSGIATGGLGKFLGLWKTGGYTGDGDPNEVAGLVHRGEFVLDAETTKAIRSGSSISSSGSSLSATGGPGVNFTQNITFQGAGSKDDIGVLCDRIAEATRNGMRQAGEMANVVTKVGAKKAGINAL